MTICLCFKNIVIIVIHRHRPFFDSSAPYCRIPYITTVFDTFTFCMTPGDDSDDDLESTIVTVTLHRHTAGWDAVSRIVRFSPVREFS